MNKSPGPMLKPCTSMTQGLLCTGPVPLDTEHRQLCAKGAPERTGMHSKLTRKALKRKAHGSLPPEGNGSIWLISPSEVLAGRFGSSSGGIKIQGVDSLVKPTFVIQIRSERLL